MRTLIPGFAAITLLGLLVVAGLTRADEEKVPLDKVPKAVLDAVKAKFEGAKLVSAEKEVEEGKTVYDIAITHNSDKFEVEVSAEGVVLGYEKAIAVKDLPKAVSEAVEAKWPGSTLKGTESVYKVKDGEDKLESYEIQVEAADKKKFEVLVAPDGKITKETEKKAKKD
jgi:uncharacterized membrane protein YkoI